MNLRRIGHGYGSSLDDPTGMGFLGNIEIARCPHDHTVTKISPAILAFQRGQCCVAVAGAAFMGLAFPAPPGLVQALEKSGDYRCGHWPRDVLRRCQQTSRSRSRSSLTGKLQQL